jgi:hypothetical protein
MNTQLKSYLNKENFHQWGDCSLLNRDKRDQQDLYTTTKGCVTYNEKENGSTCDGLWNAL